MDPQGSSVVRDHGEGRSRWVGRVVRDKWRVDARLAVGGVGTVYAATHRNNGHRVALKVLRPELSLDPDARSRFLQEGYAANHVNHPGVVRILDDDVTEDGHAFLVMELLEGEILEDRRRRCGGTLPVGEVLEFADQLLDVLAAAHAKGIVHRDIKPENLFITESGRLKVLDFGFAQMKSGLRTEQTATGFLLGTPGFMAPEQAIGNRSEIDAQTDIWALGATLFTCLSGQPVHDGESIAERLVAAANYPAPSVATVCPGLPPQVVQIVDRALAFDKKARWPDAASMQRALRPYANRVNVRTPEVALVVPSEALPPTRRSARPRAAEESPASDGPTLMMKSPREADTDVGVPGRPWGGAHDTDRNIAVGRSVGDEATLADVSPANLHHDVPISATAMAPIGVAPPAGRPTARPPRFANGITHTQPAFAGTPAEPLPLDGRAVGARSGSTPQAFTVGLEVRASRPDGLAPAPCDPARPPTRSEPQLARGGGTLASARPSWSDIASNLRPSPIPDVRTSWPDGMIGPSPRSSLANVTGEFARPGAERRKRLLVFVGVAALSMALVVAVGLLVLGVE